MASMEWLWRRVCTPNCTSVCKRYCPGCRARAGEWAASGPEAEQSAPREKRTMRIRELARCAVDCLSADVKALFGRRSKRDTAPPQVGTDPQPIKISETTPSRHACGCQASSDDETDHAAARSHR